MDTICSLLRVVEYTCISVWLSNDYSSKSLHIKYIFLQCILLFFYFFHSILLCLTWYICPSLAWQEESRFSLLVNQVRFISISVLIVHDANFLFWYMSIIQFDLILHISVKLIKSPSPWPFHSSINVLLRKQLIRIAKKLLTWWLSFDPTPNLRTNFIRNIWLIVRRNFIKILEMKGLTMS